MEYCIKLQDVEGYSPEGHKGTVNRILIDEKMGVRDFVLIHCEVFSEGGAEIHSHTFDQGFYVLSGEGRVRIGRKEYHVGAGSAYCAPAGIEHQIVAIGPESLRVIRVDLKKEG
jgi:mannose-6-phosphate isomerase-like protein (cupin superfamily)